MSNSGNNNDTQNPNNPSDSTDSQSFPDYEFTMPEEPSVTESAQKPSDIELSLIKRVLENSIGGGSEGFGQDLIPALEAMKQYAENNPEPDSMTRKVDDYTYDNARISGWFTIPEDGDFSNPTKIVPANIDFIISESNKSAAGNMTTSLIPLSIIYSEKISNFISNDPNCVSKINNGIIYLKDDSDSSELIITADFEDNGIKHSIYYRQIGQKTEESSDTKVLCILDDKNIDYYLFAFDVETPTLTDEYILM